MFYKKEQKQNGWSTIKTNVRKVTGIHDLFLVFKGNESDLFNLDWWKFKQ